MGDIDLGNDIVGEMIPIHGLKIQVSEIWFHLPR